MSESENGTYKEHIIWCYISSLIDKVSFKRVHEWKWEELRREWVMVKSKSMEFHKEPGNKKLKVSIESENEWTWVKVRVNVEEWEEVGVINNVQR